MSENLHTSEVANCLKIIQETMELNREITPQVWLSSLIFSFLRLSFLIGLSMDDMKTQIDSAFEIYEFLLKKEGN